MRELKQNAQVQNAERQSKRQRIEEMTEFLNEQTGGLIEYDVQLVRRLIGKITIFDAKVTVEFKYSVEIDIGLEIIRSW